MARIDGSWAVEVATLAGSRRFDLTLHTDGGVLTGTAVGAAGASPIRDGSASADVMEFVVDFASPVATSMRFRLQIIGDRLTGTAQSGLLPASAVVGRRTA